MSSYLIIYGRPLGPTSPILSKRFSERTQKIRRLSGSFVDMSNLQRLRLEAFLDSYQNKFKRETEGP